MRSPRRTGVLAPITREWLFALLLLSPCLLFTCLFALYPIARSLHLSMHRMILSVPGSGTAFVGLQNFIDLAADPEAAEALWHTIIFVTVSTFLEVLLGLGIALVINRRFRGRGIVRASVLVPWAIPTAVASQLWRFIFSDQYGLLNLAIFGSDIGSYRAWLAEPSAAFTAVIAADVWKTSSFAALLILAGLQIIPDELYEAAAIDGASAWQRFRRITLPMVRPAIVIALLFRTMDAFRVFDLVFVMTQGGPGGATGVLQFYGYRKIFAEGFMGYGSAVSVLVFLVTFVISLAYIRAIGVRMLRGAP